MNDTIDQGWAPLAKPLAIAGCVSLVFVTGVALYTTNRGMDIADQALYLAMADRPEASIRFGSAYHVVLHPLFVLLGESVIAMRVLRLMLDTGVDVLFGASLVAYLRTRFPASIASTGWAAVAVIIGSTIVGFSSFIMATNGFGYDELGSIVLTLLGALLLRVGLRRESWVDMVLLGAAFGALVAVLVLTRWTAALATAPAFLVTVALHQRLRHTLVCIGASLVGALGVLVSIHLWVLDIGTVAGGIAGGMRDGRQGVYSTSELVNRYVDSLRFGLLDGLVFVALLGVVVFALRLRHAGRITNLLVAVIFFAALFGELAIDKGRDDTRFMMLNSWGAVLGMGAALLWFGQAWHIRSSEETRSSLADAALTATLLIMPIVAAVGSFNPLFLTAAILSPLWVGAAIIVLHHLPSAPIVRLTGGAALALLIGAVPPLAAEGMLFPNRVWGQQDTLVEQGRFAGLYVDDLSHQFFTDLEAVRQQLEPDPTVISLWQRPAVLYALDGHGIGFPWYSDETIEAGAATLTGACQEEGDVPTGQVVIVTEELDQSGLGIFDGALRSCGISFPEDFELLTELVASDNVEVSVYVSSDR